MSRPVGLMAKKAVSIFLNSEDRGMSKHQTVEAQLIERGSCGKI